MPQKFDDGILLKDEDGTPVADRVLRVIDGLIRATDESLAEAELISQASVEQGSGSLLDADTVDGVHASSFSSSTHSADHLQSGTDELDGDKVDIDTTFSNITPNTTQGTVDDVSQLGAILAGIDDALAGASGDQVGLQIFDGLHSTNSSSYATASRMVIDFDRLPTGTPEFVFNMNAVPATSTSVRLRNVTDAADLFETTGITTTGVKTATVSLTTGKKLVYLQHLRAAGGGGGSSVVEGGSLHLG